MKSIYSMFLPENKVRKVLQKYDIPVVEEKTVGSYQKAIKVADKIGYPVVLKINSKQVSHKTEVGGVLTGLRYPNEVEQAFEKIKQNAEKFNVKFEGVLVQKMGSGYEVIIGGKRDPQFGPVVMFGLGGTLVELLKDVSFRVCPVDKKEIREMIFETKGSQLLNGFRGKPKGDIDALVETIHKVSQIMVHEEIDEMDINPLFVLPEGQGVLAVDFRIYKMED